MYPDQNGKVFKFNGGDGPARYSVLNFQREENHRYAWKEIGTFSSQ